MRRGCSCVHEPTRPWYQHGRKKQSKARQLALALTYGLLLSFKRLTSFRPSPSEAEPRDVSRASMLSRRVYALSSCVRGVSRNGGANCWMAGAVRRCSSADEHGPRRTNRTGGIHVVQEKKKNETSYSNDVPRSCSLWIFHKLSATSDVI